MLLEITKIELVPYHDCWRQSFGNTQMQWQDRRGLQVRCEDRHGLSGWGEASPLPGYSSDTLAEAQKELELLASHLPLQVEMEDASSVELVLMPLLKSLSIKAPSARFAVETAILDLWAQHRGIPISRLFQAAPQQVALSGLLQGGTIDEILSSAQQAWDRGIRTLKYKVGRPGGWRHEIAVMDALRQRFQDTIHLRLDANQAWSSEEATKAFLELQPYGIEFIEEPTRFVMEWAQGKSPIPIALDESLQRAEILAALPGMISQGWCQVLVLKPMMLGGFGACFALARLAETHGIGVVITHSFDGPIALTATTELALALSHHPRLLACGIG